ncbi:MAG: hypothetical protein IID40_11570, partial [Planctomycetes bacterium]|nr:hypothetical protein [Planctomycetota bacterium]
QARQTLQLLRSDKGPGYVAGCHNWREHPEDPPALPKVITKTERILADLEGVA